MLVISFVLAYYRFSHFSEYRFFLKPILSFFFQNRFFSKPIISFFFQNRLYRLFFEADYIGFIDYRCKTDDQHCDDEDDEDDSDEFVPTEQLAELIDLNYSS